MDNNSEKKTGMKAAVVLINMGGPENLSEVKGFIRNLFLDPHIIDKPGIFRSFLAAMISTFRAPKVREHYRAIGGGSPLKKWASVQAEKTAGIINRKYPGMVFKTAYSYSSPRIIEMLRELSRAQYDRIVAFPLYPQFSKATLGSIYSDIAAASLAFGLSGKILTLPPFYEHNKYIDITVRLIQAALKKIDESQPYHVVFTAHALPQKLIADGDPYGMQVSQTIYLVLQKLRIADYTIAFQSKIGPVKWMQPSTVETIREIGKKGIRQVVVVPIGFVCDHIETLYELDIELAQIAAEAGIESFVRADVFNDYPDFIEFLAEYIEEFLP